MLRFRSAISDWFWGILWPESVVWLFSGLALYHIPRSWVHPGENLLVLHEELGCDPSKISFLTKICQEICAHVLEADPPPADSWKPDFGTPEGYCGTFSPRVCHANILSLVQQALHWPRGMFNLRLYK